MNIKELKSMWKNEKSDYQNKEIGSGVQIFVKNVLKSIDIFNLSEGKLSTPDDKRKNEFLEEISKKSKRADIIIYITNEIIIPVEVEKYGNIRAGEKQLFDYQLVWDKKTGILTDGNEWIFYLGKIAIKSFTIDNIFNKSNDFLTFWNEYIQPINYYIQFFKEFDGKQNVWQDSLNIEENRQNFFKDITTLINSFKDKLNIKGYFNELYKDKSFIQDDNIDRQIVEISYAYLIQFILYKTLVDNEFAQFNDDFEDRQNRILINLENQNYGDILTVIKAISNQISTNIYRPFKEEQEVINKQLETFINKPKNELIEVTPWLDIFIFIQRYNFANIQNDIFGFIYENYLKQLYDDKLGQYFTAPEVTNYMLELIGYYGTELNNNINDNKISIIDPSCGSGTFLYSAVRNIIESKKKLNDLNNLKSLITDNIFGIDVAEFPLYLAEMSIIMQMLPIILNDNSNNPVENKIKIFKTKDSLSEFLNTSINNTLHDKEVKKEQNHEPDEIFSKVIEFDYKSYVRDKSDLENLKLSLENQYHPPIDRYRFDYVIGNPPYISYNECCSQGILFFQLLREKKKVNLNNVYGMNLHSVTGHSKKYRPNPNIYAFFMALGIALLKDNGKLCYIIPQTLLTASDLDVLRYHLSKYTKINKIIIFHNNMFVDRGLQLNKVVSTSSMIIFLERSFPSNEHEVEIIYYQNKNDNIKDCLENIKLNKEIIKKKTLQKDLEKNFKNWNYIIHSQDSIDILKVYKENTESLEKYYNHQFSKYYFKDKFIFDSGYDIDDKIILKDKPDNIDYYFYPQLNKHYYTIKNVRGYFPNNRNPDLPFFIKLRQANQGYELLDATFKIIWSYLNTPHFFFTDNKVIWPRNQICAIGSENRSELFYLFALLNSDINNYILTNYLKSENEKNLQISTSSIKDFFRIPIITERNILFKKEIIKNVEKLLSLEDVILSDIVDFSNVKMQKFNNISFDEEYLILHNFENQIKCKILKNEQLIIKHFENFEHKELFDVDGRFSLQKLKSCLMIDNEQIEKLMNINNDLIFALYFKLDVNNINEINKICKTNEYYEIIHNALYNE